MGSEMCIRDRPGARTGTGAAPEPPNTPLGLLGLVVVAGGSRTARYWAVWAGVAQGGASCAIAVSSLQYGPSLALGDSSFCVMLPACLFCEPRFVSLGEPRSESRSHGGPKPREAALGTSVDSLSLT